MDNSGNKARSIVETYSEGGEDFDSAMFELSEWADGFDTLAGEDQDMAVCTEIVEAYIALYEVAVQRGDILEGEVYGDLLLKAKGYIHDAGVAEKLVDGLYQGPKFDGDEWKDAAPPQTNLPEGWDPKWGDPPTAGL